MKGGNVNEFLDHVTYEDVAVRYKGKKYFYHGLQINQDTRMYELTIDLWDDKDWYVETVYRTTAMTANECMHQFLTDPIIEGRCFWDIEL